MTACSSLAEVARSSRALQGTMRVNCLLNLTDRLPTVSASQVLKEEQTAVPLSQILFGLETLDRLIHGAHRSQQSGRGLQRGRITEIYGPPGVGKTILW